MKKELSEYDKNVRLVIWALSITWAITILLLIVFPETNSPQQEEASRELFNFMGRFSW
jgi:hypothetical protein